MRVDKETLPFERFVLQVNPLVADEVALFDERAVADLALVTTNR